MYVYENLEKKRCGGGKTKGGDIIYEGKIKKNSLPYKRHRKPTIWILRPNSSPVLIITSQGYFYQCCSTTIIVCLNLFVVSHSPYKPCKISLGL